MDSQAAYQKLPPEKIKRDYPPRRREIGNEAIIEMKIIWEAVHQDDRRLPPPHIL